MVEWDYCMIEWYLSLLYCDIWCRNYYIYILYFRPLIVLHEWFECDFELLEYNIGVDIYNIIVWLPCDIFSRYSETTYSTSLSCIEGMFIWL
jgi:hypothetical protein